MTEHCDRTQSEARCLIAIETSGRVASIALLEYAEAGEFSPETLCCDVRLLDDSGRRHARTLVPELKRLLQDHDREPADIDCVAVTIGPGSFTGLRVGIACAKTLAWTVGCSVAAVGTLSVVAQQAINVHDHVLVGLNAERGQLFVAEAKRTHEAIELSETRLVDAAAISDCFPAGLPIAGPLPAKVRQQLGSHVTVLSDEIGQPSAETLAKLGLKRMQNGQCISPFAVTPEYGRLSAAEEKAE